MKFQQNMTVTVQMTAKVVGIMRQIDALYQFVCKNVAVHTNNVQNHAKIWQGANSNI